MTSPYQEVSVKEEYCEDGSLQSSHNFWDLAFNDYQEDASTQTDSFTVFKSLFSTPRSEASLELPTKLETQCFQTTPLRRTNHCYKNKSPNTVKVLMEKHRINERLRHHCLNEQLYMICRIVPGFTEEGKETKVVMMQRIISYIAYLENSIKHLSNKLNVQSDSGNHLLTHGVKDSNFSNTRCRQHQLIISEDSRDSQVSTLSLSRRLKLSSPTIDSTTDNLSQESLLVSGSSLHTSQAEGSQASDISIKIESCDREDNARDGVNMDWLLFGPERIEVFTTQDHFDSLFGNSSFDQTLFHAPRSSFEDSALELESSEVEWLGSPDKSIQVRKAEHLGIKLDPDFHEEPTHEFSCADLVSPNQVLPQTSIKRKRTDSLDLSTSQELHKTCIYGKSFSSMETVSSNITLSKDSAKGEIEYEDCQVVPCSNNKRKQLTPRRHPFTDVINIPSYDNDAFCMVEESSDIPMASNFMEIESSVEEKDHLNEEQEESPKEALMRIRTKVLQEASHLTNASKLDLRKSSWLNGFMMYSQAHRRKYIRDNPGVHTAQISKMMGQTWREMSHEQQHLYREQAKLCSQELQQVLDRKLSKVTGNCSL